MGAQWINLTGYRMAAECARNALLEKAMDNKQDPGINNFVMHE